VAEVGLIGCGGIARSAHLPTMAHLTDRVELLATADVDEAAAAAAAAPWDAAHFADYRGVLGRADIEAVVIATPEYLHCEALDWQPHREPGRRHAECHPRDRPPALVRWRRGAIGLCRFSRCLPASLPAPGLGEVEIEAIGAQQSVRLEPYATSVGIFRDNGVSAVPWLDAPVIRMLREVAAAVDGAAPAEDAVQRQRDALAAMTAIQASMGAAEAVPVKQIRS
jgi:predicted dehydrogenase